MSSVRRYILSMPEPVRSFVMADAHGSLLSLRSDRLFESSDATLLPGSPVLGQDFSSRH